MFDSSFIQPEDHINGDRFFGEKLNGIHRMKIEQIPTFLLNDALQINEPFSILTHNGDYPVTQELFEAAKRIPNFRMWYGQNIECPPDAQVQSIPIGLENDMHFPHIGKRMRLFEASRKSGAVTPSKLLYLNFSMWTNPPVRLRAYSYFKNYSWVTDECSNATSQEAYPHWLNQVLNHQYVLCPRGNGVDTHRTWETLYMGRIPIVLREANTRYYEDLPILFVDRWEDITEKLLVDNLSRLSDTSSFNIDMLKFSWWISKIKENS